MTHARFLATRHFGSLDGVRCLSILAVLWHHTHNDWLAARFADRGFLGVDMFFVLSGFLIVTLLLRERERTSDISLRAFYVRRTLRIFPVYYGLLIALTATYAIARPGDEDTLRLYETLPFYIAYLSNFLVVHANYLGVTWSLAVEEQFYLVWPTLEKWLRGARIWIAIGAGLALNQAVNFGLFDPLLDRWFGPHHPAVFEATFTPILLGATLAHLLDDEAAFSRLAPFLRWPTLFAAALFALVAFSPGDISGWPRLAIQLAMTGFLASLVVREDHEWAPVLRLWPIERIGIVSYGMYLFHLPVRTPVDAGLKAVGAFDLPGVQFVALVLAAWAVSELSFRLYESRFLALKSRFGG